MAVREPPLNSLKVLDMTEYMAGPYCTAILADMGATVWKVERPGRGDSIRSWDPDNPRNPQFLYMNRNKLGVTLNFKASEGREIFLKLVDRADVLVENYRPTVLKRAGLGWDILRARNPRLIYCSLSGFGYDGPLHDRPCFDMIAQAMGGLMHVTGEPERPPTIMGQPICDLGTGLWAVTGILAALNQRERTGIGQRVECSLLETAVAFSAWSGAQYLATDREPVRLGARHRQAAPYQRFSHPEGYIIVCCGGQRLFERFCRAVGHEDWLSDPRFENMRRRRENLTELEREIEAMLAEHPLEWWMDLFAREEIPYGRINNYQQVFDHPQVKHREMVVYCDDPEFGSVPHLRMPVRLSNADISVRHTAPTMGQHTTQVLHELGYSDDDIQALRETDVI